MNPYHRLIKHSGIQPLFHAIEMSVTAICNDYPLHLHTEGLRGTGKTTVIRAARYILPPIIRIKNCIYNCHPAHPHCPLHRHLSPSQITQLGTEAVSRPFLEISHSAKPGSIVGSIDLSKLTDQNNSLAALLPGTIPQAHRGIIFIDEINRLADTSPELADILLDVMGTKPGRIQIEEPGLPLIEMPISVSIWAASNPDEDPGALRQVRRQLSDRFDLTIPVSQPNNIQSVFEILKNRSSDEISNETRSARFESPLREINISDEIRNILAAIYVNFKLESLRAIEAVETSSGLEALLAAQTEVTLDHVASVIPYTLGHRTDANTIAEILQYLSHLKDPKQSSAAAMPAIPIDKNAAIKSPECWWKKLLQNLAAKLNSGVHKDLSAENQKTNNQNNKTMQLLKPAATTITAPPKLAAPLSQMPDQKLLTTPDKQHDEH